MTGHERFGWEAGDYTEDCYRAAGWGDPPVRYWVPAKEWMHRLGILDRRYRSVGVLDCGSSVEIDFGTASDADAVPEHDEFSLREDPASEGSLHCRTAEVAVVSFETCERNCRP